MNTYARLCTQWVNITDRYNLEVFAASLAECCDLKRVKLNGEGRLV